MITPERKCLFALPESLKDYQDASVLKTRVSIAECARRTG